MKYREKTGIEHETTTSNMYHPCEILSVEVSVSVELELELELLL